VTPRPGTDASTEAFDALVRARRTSLVMDPERPVEMAVVRELCALATWAPNHKLTWPWVFAIVVGDGRARLGEVAADAMARHGDPAPRVAKTRGKFLRAPVVVAVGTLPGDTELRTAENRDAVAAGIQNLLLGATARGLASFWSSCPKGANDPVAAAVGFPAGTHVTGLVYLGWPSPGPTPATIERPPAEIRVVDA
jgi:nitroreductase